MLAAIFGSNAARFSYNGDSTVSGRLLSEFGFRVPQENSRYAYVFGKERRQQVNVPYAGTFLVDPKTSDLVRLVIRTSQLPAETGTCGITRTLDYGRVRLNDADFLLPTQARVSVIHADETVAENSVHYSACREFQAESTLRFETLPETEWAAASQNPPVRQPVVLPAGLSFKLVFTEPIDTAAAAAGDPIRAKLKTAIRDSSSKVLVPEGAVVTSSIVGLRNFYQPPPAGGSRKAGLQQLSLAIAVRLETLDVGGVARPFKAAFDTGKQRFAKLSGALSVRVDIGPLNRLQDPDTGVFEFWDEKPEYVVESGLESNWVTIAQ